MGIQVEFNPDIALRDISEYKNGNRKIEECIPEDLEVGKVYPFLKKGQRNYWFFGEMPLLETKGNEQLSRPKASIKIIECIHFIENGEMYTRGKYEVVEVFEGDEIQFEGCYRVGEKE